MIGHAVADLPGTSFVMPEPTAAAVTGYGGSGGAIANGAGADAANEAPNEVAAAVSETALVAVAPLVDPRLAGAPFRATTTAAPGGAETYIGAPMSPEHSDGLDDGEPPARTVAAGETRFERLRRIILHSAGYAAPSASDGAVGTMGSLMTAEGRRSARSTSATRTGDDIDAVEDDGAAQSRIEFNIREERRVLDRLRAALAPLATLDSLDFPETCGSTLMGGGWEAYYNEPPVRLASTTEAGNDNDSTAVGGTMQGTVDGPLTLAAATESAGEVTTIPNPRMCINQERCGRTHSYSSTMDITAYCCDEVRSHEWSRACGALLRHSGHWVACACSMAPDSVALTYPKYASLPHILIPFKT